MKTTKCELCGARLLIPNAVLATAASDQTAEFQCGNCGADHEAIYVTPQPGQRCELLCLTVGKLLEFRASGALVITGGEGSH